MPALLPAPGVVRFAVQATLGDDLDVLNIFHIVTDLGTEDPPGTDLVTAGGTMAGLFADNFVPLLGGDYFLKSVTAKFLGIADGSEGVFVESTPVQGGTGGGDFPANVALVVSWHETISYRGGHPRTYLAGIPRSAGSDPQHVSGAYAADVASAAAAFNSGVSAATWPTDWGTSDLCVVYYKKNNAVLDPPHVGNILSATVNTRMDSQRRRLQS